MLSPRREHHLQLTTITTIGNCSRLHEDTYFETHALVEARTSFNTAEIIYGIANTIEKTKHTKNTKMSEPMVSLNHRAYQTNQENQDFRTNG